MLGRHHISISMGTVAPFLIPLLFIEGFDIVLPLAFFFAVFIGSLTPDADCGGKATLYYRFKLVDIVMKKVINKAVILLFDKVLNKHYNLEYEVKEEHRGIMHAPMGIFLSSLILSLLVLVVTLIIGQFNILLFLAILFGLLIGQALHLLEDSCTISGINWKFPFGTAEMKGSIYTFQKQEHKKDVRPMLYQYLLGIVSIGILVLSATDFVAMTIVKIYLIATASTAAAWIVIILTAKSQAGFWYQDVERIKKVKNMGKSIGPKPSKAKNRSMNTGFGGSLLLGQEKPRTKGKKPKKKRKEDDFLSFKF